MQGIILNEIDNLIDYGEILDIAKKIKQDLCLNTDESSKYNKYLLIQTFIELHDKSILLRLKKELLTFTTISATLSKSDELSHLRINFIRKR